MMKYLDCNISVAEQEGLEEHISECRECSRAFSFYSAFDFSGIKVNVPEIEDKIMLNIYSRQDTRVGAVDNICLVFGGLSFLIGLGTIFVINKTDIILAMLSLKAFREYAGVFDSFSDFLNNAFSVSVSLLNNGFSMEMWQFVGVLLVVLILFAQAIFTLDRQKNN